MTRVSIASVRWFALLTVLASVSSTFAFTGTDEGAHRGSRASGARHDETPLTVFGSPPAGVHATTTHFQNDTNYCWGLFCFPTQGSGASSSITVTGLPDSIWDLDLTTFVVHNWNSDLRMTVTSPSGTVARLAYQRGQNGSDGYNGALFDDSASILVTDHAYPNGPVTPVVPEAAFGRFMGENPNGTWTFAVDDLYEDEDTFSPYIDAWSMDITTLDAALSTSTLQASDSTPVPIANPGTATSMITVAGAGALLCDVDVTTYITHTWNSDLDISITSPAGTTVVLSTGNGGQLDNVFNGSLWNDQAAIYSAADAAYINNLVTTPIVGEGKLGKFIGEDPNGTWTLTVDDRTSSHPGANDGTIESWSLDITTCVAAKPGESYCFGDGLDPIVTAQCPCTNFGAEAHGCANSAFANGALLTATGTTSPNTVLFTMSGVPNNTLATGFRNTTNTNPAGVVFGDGVRCQSGVLIRFSSHNTGTLGDAPNAWTSPTDTIAPGLTRYYQVQYRNSAPAFCPPATFNISNGYRIDW